MIVDRADAKKANIEATKKENTHLNSPHRVKDGHIIDFR